MQTFLSVARVAPNSVRAKPLNHALLLKACHSAPPQKKEPFELWGEVCFPLAVGFSLPRMPRLSAASPLPCNRASGTAADWQRVSRHLISLHIITQARGSDGESSQVMQADKQEALGLFSSAKIYGEIHFFSQLMKIKQYSLNQRILTVIYPFSLWVNSPVIKKLPSACSTYQKVPAKMYRSWNPTFPAGS